MKKLFTKSISVLLALLMVCSSTITALATGPSCAVKIDASSFFGGTLRTADAEFNNIPADYAQSITEIKWTLIEETGTTDYSGNITVLSFNMSDVSEESTVSITGKINITVPQSYGEKLVLRAECDDTYFAEETLTVLKPIESISIREADTSANSYYDEQSSTFYLDQTTKGSPSTGTLSVINTPEINDDTMVTPSISPSYDDANKKIVCTENSEASGYDFTIPKSADVKSTVTFQTKSGRSKKISLIKCVALASFKLNYGAECYASTAFPNDYGNSLSVVQGDNIAITETALKSINGGSDYNDDIKYTLYSDLSDPANPIEALHYSIQLTDTGCVLTISNTGTYYLKAQAVSFTNGKLERTLYCVLTLNVNEQKNIKSIQFTNPSYNLYYGQNNENSLNLSELLVIPPGEYNDSVEYVSLDSTVATVDSVTGKLTVVPGTTGDSVEVVARSKRNNNVSASCTVNIIPAVQTIELKAKENSIPVGHSEQIDITVSPSNSPEKISWTSTDGSVARVDESGYVTALKVGETTITATSQSGVIANYNLTVVESKKAESVTLTPKKVNTAALQCIDALTNTYSIYQGDTISVTCDILAENGEESNDVIEWRASLDDGGAYSLVSLDTLSNYFTYTFNSDNVLTITTAKTCVSDIHLYAFAVVRDKNVSIDNVPYAKLTILSNAKTTSMSFNPTSTSKTLPTGTTYSFTVTTGPNVINNVDKIVLESSNPDIADVYYDEATKTATVVTKQLGVAKINCYACYDEKNPKETKSFSKTLTVTVTNNIENSVVYGVNDVVYSGTEYKVANFPYFSVVFANSVVLINGTDYSVSYKNNKNVGVATIVITGKNSSYQGTKTVTFNIIPKVMNDSEISVSVADVTFNGGEQKPKVTVKDVKLNKTLKLNTDYVVNYSNNVASGTGYVTVTGIGNYQGSVSKAFTIKPLAITSSDVKVSAMTSVTATGSALYPQPTVTYKGVVLTNGVDYVLSYANNVNPGTATVTITGIGSFTSSRKVSFTINKAKAPAGAKSVDGVWVNKSQKKASISKLTKGSKSFKAKWKKVSGISGYQIQYSTSSKFTKKTTKSKTVSKSKTTSATVKKLKAKKKYYVRIRTYKNVNFNGKTVKVYSSWSKAKSIKTK